MKKFLALALALVCIFSMATVAFAGDMLVCPYCNRFSTNDVAAYNAHQADCDYAKRPCQYGCNNGFPSAEALAEHEYVCTMCNVHCDYCGEDINTNKAYDEHLEACKAEHYNIPVAKITETISNFLKTTDWNSIINKIVDGFQTIIDKIAGLLPA